VIIKKHISERISTRGPAQGSVREHAGLPEIRIPVQGFDLETGPYCTSFGQVPEVLRESILRVGLVNPPLVQASSSGGWHVVTGFRRLRVMRALGCKACLCRDLSRARRSRLELLLLGLHENISTRGMNEVEKAMALSRLTRLAARDAVLEKYMPLLGLAPRPDLLNSYLALDSVEVPMRRAVAEGLISMRGFQDLEPLRPDDRSMVALLITKLKLNFNKQRQFIDIISDLIGVEDIGAKDILASEPFCSLISDSEANAPQAGERVLYHLRLRRFPSLEKAEKAFRASVERLDLPPWVRIYHPPHFEGPLFRMEVVFQNGKELRNRLLHLSEIQGLESLGPPWKTGGR